MSNQSNQTYSPARVLLHSTRVPVVNLVTSVVISVCALPIVAFAARIGVKIVGSGQTGLGVVFLVLGIGAPLTVVWALVFAFRSGAWLEGTSLVKRGALMTRRVDLATAQSFRVRVPVPGGFVTRIPALYAGGDVAGRSMAVTFKRATKGFLPAPEAEALARAIGAGRRSGVAADRAAEAVRALQELAAGTPSAAARAS